MRGCRRRRRSMRANDAEDRGGKVLWKDRSDTSAAQQGASHLRRMEPRVTIETCERMCAWVSGLYLIQPVESSI